MSLLYRALMYLGSWFCHQLPARSPFLFGVQMPLCWRCTGIFFGALALCGWLAVKRRLPPLLPCLLLALLLPLDVLHAVVTHGDGNNARRLLTGLLWGFCGTSATLQLLRLAVIRLKKAPDLRLN
ncbi:MAG: hypothetical protein QOE46_1817 [Acidobacteriota bacterium]|jgi:uncharacterized membrane protein|nr:hypothetical protein [Acidobacteriota bacterium]